MSPAEEGPKARATRAALTQQIRATCPGMSPHAADDVVSAIPVRSRGRARHYLDEHTDALTSGDPTAIPSVLFLIKLLADAGRQEVRQPACSRCGRIRPLPHRVPEGRICSGCQGAAQYRASVAVCRRCGKTRPCPARGVCSACYYQHEAPKRECTSCGQRAYCTVSPRDGDRLLCGTCRSRRNVTCGFCGRVSPSQVNWPRGPACDRCYARVLNHPAACPQCNRTRALIGQADDVAVCGTCSGYTTDYTCTRCDSPAHTKARPLCLRCAVDDQLAKVLAAVTSPTAAEQLQQVRAVLAHADRPGPALNWLRRSLEHRLFASLTADGSQPISHASVDDVALNISCRGAESLRNTLVAAGVLPHRDEHLARVELYVRRTVRDHPQFAGILRPYVSWSVLPRLRRRAHRSVHHSMGHSTHPECSPAPGLGREARLITRGPRPRRRRCMADPWKEHPLQHPRLSGLGT